MCARPGGVPLRANAARWAQAVAYQSIRGIAKCNKPKSRALEEMGRVETMPLSLSLSLWQQQTIVS